LTRTPTSTLFPYTTLFRSPFASASQRLRPHSPLWFPCQPPARHPPAALLSTTRSSTAITDRTTSLSCPGTEPTLALSQMRRPHGDRKSTRLNSSHVAISYA